MANFDLENYATVQERIAQFYQDFPTGSVRTFMVKHDGPEVIFEARVFRSSEEAAMGVYTSGWAREIEGKQGDRPSKINLTSHLENCESSAVGRALANLGYATDKKRPSREEMLKVARTREDHEALLEYIKAVGPRIPEEAEILIGGKVRSLKGYVRENWTTIKEQFRVARQVVDAVERSTGADFQREAA
jgi:hypothetical protein